MRCVSVVRMVNIAGICVHRMPLREDEGRIVRWYGILFDIDESKKTESALQQREHELLGIIDTIPSLVWSGSPTGEPTYLSKRVLGVCASAFCSLLVISGFGAGAGDSTGTVAATDINHAPSASDIARVKFSFSASQENRGGPVQLLHSEPVNEQKYSHSHMTAGAKHAHRVSF